MSIGNCRGSALSVGYRGGDRVVYMVGTNMIGVIRIIPDLINANTPRILLTHLPHNA